MDPAVSGLLGAGIGAAAGITGTLLVLRNLMRLHRLDIRRDAYLAFIDALDQYHLGLLDYASQAEYHFVYGVAAFDDIVEALKELKLTRSQSTAAWRRLTLFGEFKTREIGKEAIKSVIAFPEFDVNTWKNSDQAKRDLRQIDAHADEVEALIEAFVAACRGDLGFEKRAPSAHQSA